MTDKVWRKNRREWCDTVKYPALKKCTGDRINHARLLECSGVHNVLPIECVCSVGEIIVGCPDCSLPRSIRSIHAHQDEAPGRQVMSLAVKIAAGNPIL